MITSSGVAGFHIASLENPAMLDSDRAESDNIYSTGKDDTLPWATPVPPHLNVYRHFILFLMYTRSESNMLTTQWRF